MHDTEVAHSKDKDQDVELVTRSMEKQSVTQPPHQHHMDHLTGTDQQETWSTHYLMYKLRFHIGISIVCMIYQTAN